MFLRGSQCTCLFSRGNKSVSNERCTVICWNLKRLIVVIGSCSTVHVLCLGPLRLLTYIRQVYRVIWTSQTRWKLLAMPNWSISKLGTSWSSFEHLLHLGRSNLEWRSWHFPSFDISKLIREFHTWLLKELILLFLISGLLNYCLHVKLLIKLFELCTWQFLNNSLAHFDLLNLHKRFSILLFFRLVFVKLINWHTCFVNLIEF